MTSFHQFGVFAASRGEGRIRNSEPYLSVRPPLRFRSFRCVMTV